MSKLAPAVVQTGLLRVLHRAFVQARNLALKGDCQQLYDLADTFELLPELMASWDESTLGRIRSILSGWKKKAGCGPRTHTLSRFFSSART